MRTCFIIVSLLMLAACGKDDPFTLNLAKSIGAEESGDIKKLNKDVDGLRKRIDKLEANLAQIEQNIVSQAAKHKQDLASLGAELEAAILAGDSQAASNLSEAMQTLQEEIAAEQNTRQAQYDSLLPRLVELEREERMTEIVDPCPSVNAAFREVIIKTSSGKTFGYFENGGQRFLTVLSPGTYRTTDSRGCVFTI